MVTDLFVIRPLTLSEKMYAGTAIFLPHVMLILFFVFGLYHNIPIATWVIFWTSLYLTIFGVTMGYHRLLTHRSFTANRYLKIILTGLGCMSFEGQPIFWVASHRRHHQFSDDHGDPHSPHLSKNKLWNFWHAHIGWMMNHQVENWRHYAKDLLKDKDIIFINRHFIWFALSGIIIPTLINTLYFGTWHAFWQGLFFCGFVRLVTIQHFTWGINSITHLFGSQQFDSQDRSRNNVYLGILACGEGWHNNHHAFPFSARHGLMWWQLDLTYVLLKIFSWFGLVEDIRLPTTAQLEKKRLPDKSTIQVD